MPKLYQQRQDAKAFHRVAIARPGTVRNPHAKSDMQAKVREKRRIGNARIEQNQGLQDLDQG
jgi:hypothetical protein